MIHIGRWRLMQFIVLAVLGCAGGDPPPDPQLAVTGPGGAAPAQFEPAASEGGAAGAPEAALVAGEGGGPPASQGAPGGVGAQGDAGAQAGAGSASGGAPGGAAGVAGGGVSVTNGQGGKAGGGAAGQAQGGEPEPGCQGGQVWCRGECRWPMSADDCSAGCGPACASPPDTTPTCGASGAGVTTCSYRCAAGYYSPSATAPPNDCIPTTACSNPQTCPMYAACQGLCQL